MWTEKPDAKLGRSQLVPKRRRMNSQKRLCVKFMPPSLSHPAVTPFLGPPTTWREMMRSVPYLSEPSPSD
ncbi:hypothetical protein L484_025393 [Morus notabilis]|uniref:Uncharacterized protein n=1 Tax=Morus notabilis TaxID=981085 RepID=W9RAH7_9ROSA|nr:hypothetical protein L484_025393 [Morus notabilis]